MANSNSTSRPTIYKISQHERFDRVKKFGIPLRGPWLAEAGFSYGMPVKLRIMPGCIVITAQNFRELWQCLEGLSLESVDQQALAAWLKTFPGGLAMRGKL